MSHEPDDLMAAVEIEGGFGIDHLRLTQRRRPAQLGPGQVLVRMRAASLNSRDLLTVEGVYNPRQPLPLIPCSDGAGEVAAVAPDVDRVELEDRVVTCFAQGWVSGEFDARFRHITLGGPLDGTLVEYMVLDQGGIVRAPEHLDHIESSTLPCAALTAWNAVVEQGDVSSGNTILIQGTGGVAMFALQFAVALGATAIVTSKSDGKLARARQLGAAHTINYVETPDWSLAVKDMNNGLGVDHVIELGGRTTLRQSVRAVRGGGRISMIGVLDGPVAELDLPLVVMRNVRLQGVTVGSRGALGHMIEFMERHRMKPVIDRVFDLPHAADAFRYFGQSEHFGKVCVTI